MTVPIHALNGLELRKAVATALGFERVEIIPYIIMPDDGSLHPLWPGFHAEGCEDGLAPFYSVRRKREMYAGVANVTKVFGEPVPYFEESLDACFAPGGPVERLEAENGGAWLRAMDYIEGVLRDEDRSYFSLKAEDYCYAFLAAMEASDGR